MGKKTKKEKALDILLASVIVDAVILLVGTVCFTWVYIKTGGVPDSVVVGFYGCFGFEVIACTIIKIFKLKFPDKNKEEENYG